jgi:thioredoxin 1
MMVADKDSVLNITDESFDNVAESGLTIVDFWAEWCMPCRMQGPIMESLAKNLAGKATISKLNVDDNPQTAARFGITGIPTSVLLKDGKEVQRFVGVQSEDTLRAAIDAHLYS